MRNMPFTLTKEQYRNGIKTVTRRLGWEFLIPGDVFMGIDKGQGLKKGEHPVKLGPAEVVSVRREPLRSLTDDLDYGYSETEKEGFPWGYENSDPFEFVAFFCRTHKRCTPETIVRRIEFERIVF
jgi:hypothetical protein